MSKHIKKRELFERGVEAFEKITGKSYGLYVCPICAKGYDRHQLEAGTLTLEHVPPKSLGGKGIVLTCKNCNSTAGHSVDAALANRREQNDCIEAIIRGEGCFSGKGKLEMGGEIINIDLSVDDESIAIRPIKERNDPKKLAFLNNYMRKLANENQWNGEKFNITPRVKYHRWFSKVGDLRTAYLICFATFGYRYILSNMLSIVRQQLLNYSEQIIEEFWITSDKNEQYDIQLILLKKPINSIAVSWRNVIILLPWFGGPENLYEYMKQNFKERDKIDFKGEPIPMPQSPEFRLDFYERRN